MAHVRTALRLAVVAAVNLTASLTAYPSRTYPLDDDKLPGARVYMTSETITDEQDMADNQVREVECMIEICAKANSESNLDTTLDGYCVEVEEAMDTNLEPNTNVLNIDLVSTEIDWENLEKDIGKATLTYSILYVVNPSDVETVAT